MKKSLLSSLISCVVLVAAEPGSVDQTAFTWPLANGTLIIGCNGTVDDVMPQTEEGVVLVKNENAQARASGKSEVAGNHCHDGCATLDILPSARKDHVCLDITKPITLSEGFPGYEEIYLEMLYPDALFNQDRAMPTNILHVQTIKNCVALLRDGGTFMMDINTSILFQEDKKLKNMTMFWHFGRLQVIAPNVAEAITQAENLSVDSQLSQLLKGRVYQAVCVRILEELKAAGLKEDVGVYETEENPFNGRTEKRHLIMGTKKHKKPLVF